MVKIKNFLLRLIKRPICIYLMGKLTIRIAAKIIRKKQNCAQKFISGEFISRDLPSLMNGAATSKAAPGTGIPLKNPGILSCSKIKNTSLVTPQTMYSMAIHP